MLWGKWNGTFVVLSANGWYGLSAIIYVHGLHGYKQCYLLLFLEFTLPLSDHSWASVSATNFGIVLQFLINCFGFARGLLYRSLDRFGCWFRSGWRCKPGAGIAPRCTWRRWWRQGLGPLLISHFTFPTEFFLLLFLSKHLLLHEWNTVLLHYPGIDCFLFSHFDLFLYKWFLLRWLGFLLLVCLSNGIFRYHWS